MMVCNTQTVRALGLCSGGLDSILAALLIRSQGVQVHWVAFETPFFSSQHARCAAKENNIPLYVRNITEIYLKMMEDPDCKFGKNMNPCMDCHSLMFRLAGDIMLEKGFDFMFSGEVLGQRPMSQNKSSLRYVEKHSGYDGYVLRPLSARRLPETIPEKMKMINRRLLLDISGRSRKKQIDLADKFGVKHYPSPGGGCLLTYKGYCNRLKDLFSHQSNYPENHLHLLRFGRHMRLDHQTKIIIGRNRSENEKMVHYVDPEQDFVLNPCGVPGPVVIIQSGGTESVVTLAASICVGYSKVRNNTPVVVNIVSGKDQRQIEVVGLAPCNSKHLLIL